MLRPGAAPWWPAVRVAEAPAALVAGARVVLSVRSPLGYRLRLGLTITEVSSGEALAADSDGDLRGTGRVRLTGDVTGPTELVITWTVIPTLRWMIITAPLLRPVFWAAHARVMRAGERGLRRSLPGLRERE